MILTGRVFGQVFQLEAPDHLLDELLPRLPFGWEPTDAEPGARWRVHDHGDMFYDVLKDELTIRTRRPWGAVSADVGGSIELWAAEHAEDLVVIHAGAVAWGGSVIALPGFSLAGKSMLVQAFLRRGATYLSDEFMPIREDGRVLPYPRPLSVRPNGDGLSHLVPVESFDCPVATGPLPLGLVLEVRYDPRAGLHLSDTTPAASAMALLQHCVPAQARPAQSLAHIHHAVQGSRGLTGTRGEAVDAVEEVISLMSELSHQSG